ncbi:histone-lysine N-methyltransferase family member SUVH9-like protein [Tanacetum coccineum]|uniref:Histone-lysine N-methyltransferase family member SUVH9-like protein n=1 Tax=Tanacetum coccineum TaxID=301880 RepID=A0ABQ4ZWF6_9ASTR
MEDDKRREAAINVGGGALGLRARGDSKAASVMKDRGLWLNRDKRIVGAIPGSQSSNKESIVTSVIVSGGYKDDKDAGNVIVYTGHGGQDKQSRQVVHQKLEGGNLVMERSMHYRIEVRVIRRMELCVVGMHRQAQAGIDYLTSSQSSNKESIVTSVIVSGGYKDDKDAGNVIVYTGHGGQDKQSRQVVHQKLEGGNLVMERSMHYRIEVRVIRRFKYEGSASGKVYVYDGLYKIVEAWFEVGKSGFGVFKFKLVRIVNQVEMGSAVLKFVNTLRARPLEARLVGYVSFDISMKKENVLVFLFNDIDNNHEPMYYEYLATTIFSQFVNHLGVKGGGCSYVSGCTLDCLCAKKNGGEFAYDANGLLVRGKPLIFECGPHCRCPPGCQNQVSQKGVRNMFEVFRSREMGWVVRSLELIQASSFIREYTGVVLTRDQAKLFTMNGDALVYPNRFRKRWAE